MNKKNKIEQYFCPECGVEIDDMGREINNPEDPFRHNYPDNLLNKKNNG